MTTRITFPWLITAVLLAVFGILPGKSIHAQSEVTPDSLVATGDTTKAYIIADSLFVLVDESGKAILRHRRIVRINSSTAANYGVFAATENDFWKLQDISGYQYDAAGTAIDSVRGKKNLFKVCGFGPEFALFIEDCTYNGGFRTARVPYSVDWQYTIEAKSIGMWSGWSPEQTLFNKSGYCQIKAHPANKIRFVTSGNFTPIEAVESPEGNIHSWSITDLPAHVPERREPWPSHREARIFVVPQVFKFAGKSFDGGSWNAISKGCYAMTHDAFKSSDAQDNFYKQHLAANPESLFPAIHKSLAARMRYVAIYLSMGGWIPHSAKETFQNGYGDCKDLAALYAVMFAKAGVTTRTSLISTRNAELINPELPTIAMFNHVIMFYVDSSDTTWVDATCFDCALGDLPYSVEGVSTLVVDDINGVLLTTPASDCSENIFTRRIDIALAPDMNASITLSSHLSGNPAHGVNTLISDSDGSGATRALAYHLGITGLPAFGHKDVIVTEKDLSKIGLDIKWSNPRLLKPAGETFIFDLAGFRVTDDAETVDLSKRKQTLEIGYPQTIFDTVRVALPEGYVFKTLPTEVNYTSKFGDFTLTSSVDLDTATFIRTTTRKLNYIEPADFEAFAAHRKEINLQSRAVTTITKTQ